MAYVGSVAVKRDIRATLEYDVNPEKTKKELAELRDTGLTSEERIAVVFEYATRPAKTQGEAACFVTGLNIDVENAIEEVMEVKRFFGKTGGVEAHHFWQSFPLEDSLTPQLCHELGIETAKRVFGDRFQVVVSTHLDGTYLHNHFFVNSVSFVDGKKYYGNKNSLRRFRDISDDICRENGLSVIEPGKARYLPSSKELLHLNSARSWRQALMLDMDECLKYALTFNGFLSAMKEKGYVVKSGKHFAFGPPGMTREGRQAYIRLDSLRNDDYTLAGIERRIAANVLEGLHPQASHLKIRFVRALSARRPRRKLPYYKAAYYKRMYRYGLLKKKPRYASYASKRQGQIMAENLSRQIRYLNESGISTPEELSARKLIVAEAIQTLEKGRKAIYNASARGDERDPAELAGINAALGPLKAERRTIYKIEQGAGSLPKRPRPPHKEAPPSHEGKQKTNKKEGEERT